MKLRLSHKFFMLLLSLLVATLVLVSSLTAYDLRRGFGQYLQARTEVMVHEFANRLAAEIYQDGGADRLMANHSAVEIMLQRLQDQAGPPGPPPQPPPPWLRDILPPPQAAPPPPPGAQPWRVAIFTPQGQQWFGPALPPDRPVIEAPVLVAGKSVAMVRAIAPPPVPQGIEADFMSHQLQHMGVVGVVLAAGAAGVSYFAARRISAPLHTIQIATAQIAAGNFQLRLTPRGNDELAETLRHINTMATALGQLEAARRQWLAQISHELRTPLSVLRGEIEAILDGVRPLARAGIISLQEEVRRLGALIEDLYLLALSDLQALPCVFVACEAGLLLQEAVARFAPRAAEQGLALNVAAPEQPVLVQWDSGRIAQLFGNLLENSLRYTDSPGRITLQLTHENHAVHITLEDSAPAVSENELKNLFDPLMRVDESRSRAHGGSGLGLSIARAIVQAHGGQITAGLSKLGGLAINISLPEHAA